MARSAALALCAIDDILPDRCLTPCPHQAASDCLEGSLMSGSSQCHMDALCTGCRPSGKIRHLQPESQVLFVQFSRSYQYMPGNRSSQHASYRTACIHVGRRLKVRQSAITWVRFAPADCDQMCADIPHLMDFLRPLNLLEICPSRLHIDLAQQACGAGLMWLERLVSRPRTVFCREWLAQDFVHALQGCL